MKKKITLLFAVLLAVGVSAQSFQGVAIYKSKRKVDINLDGSNMNSEMQKRMQEMLKKQFEKTFKLTFNQEASVFKEEEKLGAPSPSTGGMDVVVAISGGADVLYKNIKEQRYTNQNDLMGKIFLIKDKLEKIDWKMEGETKNIGEYTCYKATYTREVEVRQSGVSVNGDKDLDKEAKVEKKEITITAWYTPQIPVSTGPRSYQGLPGLILEVNDGSETMICSKIVLNPEEKMEVKEPKKGKKVTQKEYDAIAEKKMKEMHERYRSRRGGNRDGETIEIRIGG
jgi:GLPGLI family protein